jgi:hypothetical protein
MALAGATRAKFHDVVIALNERDHAEQGDIPCPLGQLFRFETDASQQKILPLPGGQLYSAFADPVENAAGRELNRADRVDLERPPPFSWAIAASYPRSSSA